MNHFSFIGSTMAAHPAMVLLVATLAMLALAAILCPKVVSGIPTPQDDSLLIQDTVQKTATFESVGLDLGAGFAPGGLGMAAAVVVDVSAIDRTTGDETYTFTMKECATLGGTYTACGVATASLTATGIYLAKGFITKRFVTVTLTAGGTTPIITYKAWLNTNMQR